MISFENVIKKYGNLVAVDGVSCTIDKGEFFALLGPNGAGKTTLMRLLLGFSRCTAGNIAIEGLPAGRSESRKKLGYLAELNRIPPYLSGEEYLMRHAAFCGLTGSRAKKSVGEILEQVGMNGSERKKASQYSKGMTQRLGFGAALLGNPELLVLDEPASGLDPLGMRDIRALLEKFKKSGGTIILNSHLLSEVERLCDTVAIMNKGRIQVKGPLSHIVHGNETLEDVFIRHVEENP
ncbi:ABC transporter ATP-binding protein [Desulfopila inferna]|uniref:ABC transporter ATP-binding protein n=1 Tax=Desulfopila inferna TaxID=468528 RepID=UPI001964B46C|nr:ABC transporter ATP-binding protein [Desulfopila inferna]MBM9604151.1 ABC transporter ATP-binding protein [Desulfopila inferna]